MECEADQIKPYSKGEYNEVRGDEQWIRLSEGCPNRCPYCRESWENPKYKVYKIPKIEKNDVKFVDMNLLCHKEAFDIICELGEKKVNKKVVYYELLCGIDYRFITLEIVKALKQSRFKKLRLAWDWEFGRQKEIKKAINLLLKAGFSTRDITVFVICNWKIHYEACLNKMELCKVWNVKMADCYFDNQLSPNIKPIHWTAEQIKDFRKRVRKHNQLVNFRIDPEYDGDNKSLLLF